jgi:NitT/TauT family transport system ATP-binding protein
MSRGSSVARTQETAAGAAISVRGLWKAFYDGRRKHTVVAVQDLSLDVPAGEFVCVVGPSGCGKTTFLRMLAGLDEPVAGTISIADGARPAMVFQDTSVFPWLTVEQNVAYPLRLRRVPRRERARRVEPLLAMTGLLDFRAAYPHQLSGGMKQRTTVARALAEDSASVLLMDEPFGALDEQTRVTLQQELLRVWEKTRKTVVFITHSVDEALTLADRVLVMSSRPGRFIADIRVPFGRPRDVLELRRDPDFGEITYRVWQLLKSQPDTSLEGESTP